MALSDSSEASKDGKSDNTKTETNTILDQDTSPPLPAAADASSSISSAASEKWEPYENVWPIKPFKYVPQAVDYLRQWTSARWLCRYPFQQRVFNRYTVGEIFIVWPAFLGWIAACVVVYFGKDLEGSGSFAQVPYILVFLLAMRNSFATFVLGIPFERALAYHKLAALAAIAGGFSHGFIYHIAGVRDRRRLDGDDPAMVLSGWLLQGAAVALLLTSLYPIRRYFYQWFLEMHLVFAIVATVGGLMHGAGHLLVGLCFVVADSAFRMFCAWRWHAREASFVRLPANVIRLTFPKGKDFSYKSGQYVFICIPKVSSLEFHPFSISSSPHEDTVSIHIRVLGDWTQRLYDIVTETDGDDSGGRKLSVFVEGSYGETMVNLDDGTYKHVLLISGGIGITPMHSITADLLDQYERGRPMTRVHCAWAVRDRYMVSSVYDRKAYSTAMPLSFSPNLLEGVVERAGTREGKGFEFVSEFFLTKVRAEDDFSDANINPELQPGLRFGRPDVDKLFVDMRKSAVKGERIAVLVCGPFGLVSRVRKAAIKHSHDGIIFDFHTEKFEF